MNYRLREERGLGIGSVGGVFGYRRRTEGVKKMKVMQQGVWKRWGKDLR